MSTAATPSGRYRAYVSDVSYYSGKLEAYLRYAGIDHERIEVNTDTLRNTVLPATGVMKVPAMQCPDGRWLKDTTPMMRWLDDQHGRPSIYPRDPASRFIALLIEDYADEWLWRPAMYYRWNFADSHRLLRHRLGRELSDGTRYPAAGLGWYMRWRQYLTFVRDDGIRPHNEAQVKALYRRTLAQLSQRLQDRPFLLGERPSIVDFAFFASMFRHFALDPHSAKQMIDTAPAVYAWVGRVWNAHGGNTPAHGELEDFASSDWNAIFGEISRDYLTYLDVNATAYARGERHFDLTLGDTVYPRMAVVRYRVACREQLLLAYRALAAEAREQVDVRLQSSGIASWLRQAPLIISGLADEFVMPLQKRYPAAKGLAGLKLLKGTPWDMPAGPVR
jgi:glutathione S-transferase